MILFAILLTSLPGGAGAQAGSSSNAEPFMEPFARLSPNRWMISHGWSNGPHQGCTWSKENIRLDGTSMELILSSRAAQGKATCAEVQSKQFYHYGTYETRLRSVSGSGIVTTFFLYTGPVHGGSRKHQQISFEFPGRATRSTIINYSADGKMMANNTVALEFDGSERAHDYAIEWLPDSIRWFVDGRVVREERAKTGQPFPALTSKVILSLWSGAGASDEWLGPYEEDGKRRAAVVERLVFTPAGKPCQFPTSVACKRGVNDARK
jgi:endo-1,3-1,4-beta-glycanase ExoK